MDDETRQQVALWRLGVLGPLMSARLEHGDVRGYVREAAARVHRMPDGAEVQLSEHTIAAWHYAYKHGGLAALMPKERSDRGRSRAVRPEIAQVLVRAKAEKPRRSIRRLIKMLVRAKVVRPGELSRSSVHRVLQAAGVSWRPARGEIQERRSFIVECASDLCVGDAMHGPQVIAPDGSLHKSYLLTQFDCATRYATHSYFALGEAPSSPNLWRAGAGRVGTRDQASPIAGSVGEPSRPGIESLHVNSGRSAQNCSGRYNVKLPCFSYSLLKTSNVTPPLCRSPKYTSCLSRLFFSVWR